MILSKSSPFQYLWNSADKTLEIIEMSDTKKMIKQLYKMLHPEQKTLRKKMWKFYTLEAEKMII